MDRTLYIDSSGARRTGAPIVRKPFSKPIPLKRKTARELRVEPMAARQSDGKWLAQTVALASLGMPS